MELSRLIEVLPNLSKKLAYNVNDVNVFRGLLLLSAPKDDFVNVRLCWFDCTQDLTMGLEMNADGYYLTDGCGQSIFLKDFDITTLFPNPSTLPPSP